MPSPAVAKSNRRRWELAAAGLFVLANLAVPLAVEDFYPFTTTPMFRDKPRYYSDYRVYDPRDIGGQAVSPAELSTLGLQRTYDGNPRGLGVGRWPPETLDRFTETLDEQPEEEEVRRQVANRLRLLPNLPAVDVVQEIVGPLENGNVGVVRSRRWHIERQGASE
jgi:hypothetical protein